MERRIRKALEVTEEKEKMRRGKKRGWWDEKYEEKKREVKRELRRWREYQGAGESFRRGRKEYRELCERKKKEEREIWEMKISKIKKESEVWELVKKERRKGKKIDEGTEMKEWKEHFMRLLGGVGNKVVMGTEERSERRDEEGRRKEKNISREEIKEAIRKLKAGKATGADESQEKSGNMEEKTWKTGFEDIAEKYGMGEDGQRAGKKE